MSMIEKKSDYRVVVYPDLKWITDGCPTRQKFGLSYCESMVEQIKRHVDDVGHVEIEWDTEHLCEFCGYDWEVSDGKDEFRKGTPLCCNKAQEEFLREVE